MVTSRLTAARFHDLRDPDGTIMTQRDTAAALRVVDLRYAYGRTLAVDGAAFEEFPGEIFGLLGPNSAGKTTMISIASGLLPAASGQWLIFGQGGPAGGGRPTAPRGMRPEETAL